jgi:hypothetical protein
MQTEVQVLNKFLSVYTLNFVRIIPSDSLKLQMLSWTKQENGLFHTVMCISDYRQGIYWWMDLLDFCKP